MEENKREWWKKAVLPEGDTKMGFYLNSRAPYVLYEGETKSRYFIDKTLMLEKIFGFIEEEVDGLYEKYLADTVNPNGKLLDKFWSIWWDLKVDDTAESAVRQIKKRVMRYVFRENWVMTKYTRVTFWQLESVIGRTQRNMNVR